jgi:hypothetical protein
MDPKAVVSLCPHRSVGLAAGEGRCHTLSSTLAEAHLPGKLLQVTRAVRVGHTGAPGTGSDHREKRAGRDPTQKRAGPRLPFLFINVTFWNSLRLTTKLRR